MSDAVDLLSRPLYSHADVDRLTALTPGTARRWLEGYERAGTAYQPVLRAEPTGDSVVTWGEMVEARLLAEYRGRRVPLQKLRPALLRLRDAFGQYPLARSRSLVDVHGRELVMQVQDEVDLDRALRFVVLRSNQLMLDLPAQRFQESSDYAGGAVVRLHPDPRVERVVMDATRSFGQPSINGVHTEVIAEDIRAGADRHDIAALYDLDVVDVDAAIQFELIAAAPQAG